MGDGRIKNQNEGNQEIRTSRRSLPLLELVGQREKVVLLEPRNIDQLEESRTMTSLPNKNQSHRGEIATYGDIAQGRRKSGNYPGFFHLLSNPFSMSPSGQTQLEATWQGSMEYVVAYNTYAKAGKKWGNISESTQANDQHRIQNTIISFLSQLPSNIICLLSLP